MKPIPCMHEGTVYPSIRAAALAAGISPKTMQDRLNPQRAADYQRTWHRANRAKSRAIRRRVNGVVPTYPAPDACEICCELFTKEPCADHNHATGVFRGWLCGVCNRAIGLLRDSPTIIGNALGYVQTR